MGQQYTREQVRERLDASIVAKSPVLVADVGMGITAKFAELGGADMVCIGLTGLFRVDAVPSIAAILPYANANTTTLQMVKRIYPKVSQAPVLAGIAASDPTLDAGRLLDALLAMGVSGVANAPSIGYYINRERDDFEDAGMGVAREAEVLAMAREKGLYTMGYAYDAAGAKHLGEAGVDALVCDLRLTAGGSIGIASAGEQTLDEAAAFTNELCGAAGAVERGMLVLVHGGPVVTPEDTLRLYRTTPAKGVVGGSIIERLPVEGPIRVATREFKQIRIKKAGVTV